MSALALLPTIAFVLVLAAVRMRRGALASSLREDTLGAALVLGVAVAWGTEVLGALRAITFAGVLGLWLVIVGGAGLAAAWCWRRGGPPSLPRPASLDRVETLLVGGIAAVALVLLVVAALAPPQSSDSIGYHMGRVMHWIQNRTLAHYPTADDRQLFNPPLAEIVRLHLLVLTGGDLAGCFLQWIALVGALGAASLIARDLGGSRRGQIVAAVFAVTLPIGVTQATSGKNDWLTALWLLVYVHFLLVAVEPRVERPASRGALPAAGAALGLALLTKTSAWVYAPAFAIAVLVRTSDATLRRLAAPGTVALLLVASLNTAHWWRNVSLYGDPVADPAFRREHQMTNVTPVTVLSNALRRGANQLGRPTTVEENAGSPLHLVLVPASGAVLLGSRRLPGDRGRLAYLAALFAGALAFCGMVKVGPDNTRLLLPVFVLAAPVTGAVLADLRGGRLAPLIAAVLFVASLPWLVSTEGRPLLRQRGVSVLTTPRTDLYFARFPDLREPYAEVARVVRERGIHNVGLVMRDHHRLEYPLWVLLADVGRPVRLEHVGVRGASAWLAERPPFADFRPELVVVVADEPKDWSSIGVQVAGTDYPFVRAIGVVGLYALRPGA